MKYFTNTDHSELVELIRADAVPPMHTTVEGALLGVGWASVGELAIDQFVEGLMDGRYEEVPRERAEELAKELSIDIDEEAPF